MTKHLYRAAVLACFLTLSVSTFAMCAYPEGDAPMDHHHQDKMGDMPCMHGEPDDMANGPQGHDMHHDMKASNDIYAPAMDKMMKDMPEALGDADADFMRGMIVHHQAAVDMANVAMARAQNPQVRALAGAIITAQKSEIAYMRAWLRMHDFPEK